MKELTGIVGTWVLAWGGVLAALLGIGLGLRWVGVASEALLGNEYAILIGLSVALLAYVAWIFLDNGQATRR